MIQYINIRSLSGGSFFVDKKQKMGIDKAGMVC